ncbi:MAG: putative Large-conductance mechanosensitive channel-like protein [Candidatus Saccharibacteria bacterium]|nr:putative Large-conductance mechanosensitive channel-like protein [Candidatus Saccharibacteria bacterium]
MADDKSVKKPSKAAAARAKAAAARSRAAAASSRANAVTHGHGGGFIEFIRTQGVIGLAVGLAIGTAAGASVKAIVAGFINPIVQFIIGSQDGLDSASWHVVLWGRKADFLWGAAISSVITLLATALVIYWIINIFKLDKLDKKKD